MATATKKRTKKPRPGNSNADLPPDRPLIPPVDEHTASNEAADAAANWTDGGVVNEGEPHEDPDGPATNEAADAAQNWPDGKAYLDGVNIDKPIPMVPVDPSSKPDSPERLAAWDKTTINVVNRSAKEVSELRAEHEIHAERAKESKKALDVAISDHFELIRKRREGRGKPEQQELFDKSKVDHPAAQEDLREPSEVPPPEDDSWKTVPLTELVEKDGLPAKVAQLFGDAGLNTMGDVSDYSRPAASGYSKALNDIKGVGPAKVEQWQAAEEAFWKRKAAEDAARSTRVDDASLVGGDQHGSDGASAEGLPGAVESSGPSDSGVDEATGQPAVPEPDQGPAPDQEPARSD